MKTAQIVPSLQDRLLQQIVRIILIAAQAHRERAKIWQMNKQVLADGFGTQDQTPCNLIPDQSWSGNAPLRAALMLNHFVGTTS
jgi:hypothetical protein